ncbi:RloB domain-containing protein [Fusobacterium massiliense]|uniref:RloB domain-containing protein n=1 Tax=Fusobacterium massiliense TaxID=1852365 RepID=UPI0028E871D7|nr:RloB domain-containing protein [Fusobacterium massiliense]
MNNIPERKYNVKFDLKIQKDPLSRAKGITILEKTEIIHIFDKESEESIHREQFYKTLDRMKEAENLGKKIKYQLGYSNFTFELWIILHKIDFNTPLGHRSQYFSFINRAYEEQFNNLDDYKRENHFKRILKKITIDNVKEATKRAKNIMNKNKENGYNLEDYRGYKFYKENPSLSIWEIVEKILYECGLM